MQGYCQRVRPGAVPKSDKIFCKSARRISACFALSGPMRPALSRSKASPPILALQKRSGHVLANRACRCPDMGCQMGIFGQLRACCAPLTLLVAWPGSDRRPTLAPERCFRRGACGPDQEIRRAVRIAGLAILLERRVAHKWLAVQRRLDDELVQIALCDGDREGCVSPSALKLLAIVDAAKGPRGPRPAWRDQSRDQPRRQGDERPGAIWRIDVWSLAARDASQAAPAIARIMRSPNSSRCGWPASRRRTSGS